MTAVCQAMGCCGQAEEGDEERKKASKQNREIEKQIQKDKQASTQAAAANCVASIYIIFLHITRPLDLLHVKVTKYATKWGLVLS